MIDYREYVITSFKRLIGGENGAFKLRTLDIKKNKGCFKGWQVMKLPKWASDIVPIKKKGLIVPLWRNSNEKWDTYDWWRAAYFMISSEWERIYEKNNGPVHSYSYNYNQDDQIIFDHAWVNRIILFLRRWWIVKNNANHKKAFTPIPKPIVHLTHDVDAVTKTLPIRAKQALFWTYNGSISRAIKFFFNPANYWQFDNIMKMERLFGYTSTWNFYGGKGGWFRSPKDIIFDPSYTVISEPIQKQINKMFYHGHVIGLHQSFDAWNDTEKMFKEKVTIEKALGHNIFTCRQHWLRFSFDRTWNTQANAGLKTDMTLGFNDRPAFRNSAAVSFKDKLSGMRVIPMVLMDSHLYDYLYLSKLQREEKINHILTELLETGGEASIIWHNRVFHSDYGWGVGYHYLLKKMNDMGFQVA